MTKMNTVRTTLQTLTEMLDPFGASIFTEPTVKIAVEVPCWITATFGTELEGATLIHTEDDRLVAGIAVGIARAVARALDRKDATEITNVINKLDRHPDLACEFMEGDYFDELDDSTTDVVILTHLSSELTFVVYADGLADLFYGKEA